VTLVGQVRYSESLLAYDPVTTALDQVRAGASAIALFTDESLYQGGLDDLVMVSRAVGVPVISQDYFFDEYQIVEARAAGASALVLRANLLEQAKLRALVSATQRNRMTAIVEVRTPGELNYALSLSPYVIGICPQDFRAENLLGPEWLIRPLIPHNIRVMVTQDLRSLEAVQTAVQIGADAVLADAALLQDPNDAAELQSILRRSYSNPF
jgi:indole-3-glycerol phosphate synthase